MVLSGKKDRFYSGTNHNDEQKHGKKSNSLFASKAKINVFLKKNSNGETQNPSDEKISKNLDFFPFEVIVVHTLHYFTFF